MTIRSRKTTRLDRVATALSARPLCPTVLDEAYAVFCRTGELPDEDRVAKAVVERVLRGADDDEKDTAPTSWTERFENLARLSQKLREIADSPATPAKPPVRKALLEEAVLAEGPIRDIARLVIIWAVKNGADVTDPGFLAEHEVPDHPGVGLHILGFPKCLVQSPHKWQARRLLDRIPGLRARLDHSDRTWQDRAHRAFNNFTRTGELPIDELTREITLTSVELLALMAHYVGAGDAELLRALSAVADQDGEGRDAALAEVQEMVQAGRLFPATS